MLRVPFIIPSKEKISKEDVFIDKFLLIKVIKVEKQISLLKRFFPNSCIDNVKF